MKKEDTNGRWFTGTSDGHIAASFTAIEDATYAAIIAFARDPANRDHELLHCVDGDGSRIIDRSTGHKAADLTDSMKLAAAEQPVRFWHNHPSQDSLSHHDWRLAATTNLIEVLALNESGSLFVGRVLAPHSNLDDLLCRFSRIAEGLELTMSNFAKSVGMSIDDEISFSQRTSHVLNLAMSRCQVVAYAYRLSACDTATMKAAEGLGVVAKGLDFAVSEINRVLNPPTDPAGASAQVD